MHGHVLFSEGTWAGWKVVNAEYRSHHAGIDPIPTPSLVSILSTQGWICLPLIPAVKRLVLLWYGDRFWALPFLLTFGILCDISVKKRRHYFTVI